MTGEPAHPSQSNCAICGRHGSVIHTHPMTVDTDAAASKTTDEFRLVKVRWLDSMAYDQWASAKTMRERLVEMDGGLEHFTVGWVIDEQDEHIIVAASRHVVEDTWNGAMAIPKTAVIEIVDL